MAEKDRGVVSTLINGMMALPVGTKNGNGTNAKRKETDVIRCDARITRLVLCPIGRG